MPKLQRIKRANGSLIFSVNIPGSIIEELSWEKGNELMIEIEERGIKIINQNGGKIDGTN